MNKKIIMNRNTLRKLIKNPKIENIALNSENIKTILNNTSDKNYYKNLSYIIEIDVKSKTYKLYYTDENLEKNFKL